MSEKEKIEMLLKGDVEMWTAVVGYEGLYEVSDKCRIRTVKRFVSAGNGAKRLLPAKIMKPWWNEKNQLVITLTNKGETFSTTVYRLMTIAFIPNPENKAHVNHKKGNRRNNDLWNLEWNTPKENNIHAVKNGLSNPIANLPDTRKRVQQMDIHGNVIAVFNSITEAAQSVNGCIQSISCVCNGKKYCKTAHGFKWKFICL